LRLQSLVLTVALLSPAITACGDDGGGTLPLGSTTAATDTTGTTAATDTTGTTVATDTVATTATPGTTATTAPPTTLGPPPLPPVEFRPEGIGFALFGDDPENVMYAAELAFGPPSSDSGWLAGGFGDAGVCPGTEFRQMWYLGDTLMLMFSDADYFVGGGIRNFVFYSYSGAVPVTAGPPDSIDVGTTVAELTAMWPGVTVAGDDPLFGNSFSYDPGTGFEYLFGALTGVASGDTITYLSGGVGCGE
jgi:hypothetical protein